MPELYKDFQPSAWDTSSNFVAWGVINYLRDWYVCLTGRNRDSDLLSESNFETALTILGGESETVEIHRFGHWACGWYELILVHPDLKDEVDKIEKQLDNYPLLDEEGYSDKSFTAACDLWVESDLEDRLHLLGSYGNLHTSIFAIRYETLPEGIDTMSMCP